MDRMIYTALNALAVSRNEQLAGAQNLANQNVPGYRRDLPNDGGSRFLDQLDVLTTRAFQLETGPARFSNETGLLESTGQDLDIAIGDKGYFYVLPENGEVALSRRGDLSLDLDGVLRNGAGEAILNPKMEAVKLPPYSSVTITDIGEVFIVPLDNPELPPILAEVLATTIPDPDIQLTKGLDGQVRDLDGGVPPPNQFGHVMQGILEGSNVNPVEELLSTMEIQRSFEHGMRLVLTAREMDETGAQMLHPPEA